jgi:hypothetical protein
MLGDLDGASDPVDLQPPAEAAADQVTVHHDLGERQTGALRRRGLGAGDDLAADPHFAAVLPDMGRAVHRLHRRMGQERQLVGRLHLGGSARHGLRDVAGILRDRSGSAIQRRLFKPAHDVVGAESGVRPVVPLDGEGGESFHHRAHVVGHDSDGVVEPDDLADALDGLRGAIVHALDAATEDGRLRQHRDLHTRRAGVDAVDRRVVDLRRRVQALRRRADQLEVLRTFERDLLWNSHARRIGDKLAVSSGCSHDDG